MIRTITLGVMFVVAAFVATAFYYPHLPDPMPSHFDVHGRVDGWMPLPWGALMLPLTMIVLAVVFAFSHYRVASQRGDEAAGVLDLLALATLAFLLEVHVVVLLFSTGVHVDINRWVLGGVGLLFTILGNWFGKLPRNHVIGIRTPRTLADDETWLMTHRFGGRVMVLGGIAVFVAALRGASGLAILVMVVATITLPVVYSYTFKPKGSR